MAEPINIAESKKPLTGSHKPHGPNVLRYKNISFEEDICIHVFVVSATLLGACLTVIGIIQVIITQHKISTLADDLLSVAALSFITACFLSYWAIRSRTIKRMYQVERLADMIFLTGLVLLMITCAVITYAFL